MSDNFRYQSSITEPALDLRSRTNRDAFPHDRGTHLVRPQPPVMFATRCWRPEGLALTTRRRSTASSTINCRAQMTATTGCDDRNGRSADLRTLSVGEILHAISPQLQFAVALTIVLLLTPCLYDTNRASTISAFLPTYRSIEYIDCH